jgi:hypothetical protein
MKSDKTRLDQLLVVRGLTRSRTQALILTSRVQVEGLSAPKACALVQEVAPTLIDTYRPFDRPIHFLVPKIELAHHLKQLASQNLHLQAWLDNLEALATHLSRYREVVSTDIYTQFRLK